MSAGSHTSSWIYLEHLSFNYLFIYDICMGERGNDMKGDMLTTKREHVGVKEIKQVRDYGKRKGGDPDPVCPN